MIAIVINSAMKMIIMVKKKFYQLNGNLMMETIDLVVLISID